MMTSRIVVHVLYVLWMANIVSGQTYTLECDRETMTERFGYKEHPTDCGKFIQCLLNRDGQLVGMVRDCGHGTYWNPTLLNCILATETDCKHDLCNKMPDGRRRKGYGNCRGFYECQGSSSVPRCCPPGQYFHDSLVCVNNTEDITCNERCMDTLLYTHASEPFGDPAGRLSNNPSARRRETIPSVGNQQSNVDRLASSGTGELKDKPIFNRVNTDQSQTSAAKPFCDKSSISGKPGMYKQTLYDGIWVIRRSCPTGTKFVQAACNCHSIWDQPEIPAITLRANNETRTTTCTPIIYLPFTVDEQDQSGNAYQIINHNVTVRNGKAIFHGNENFLKIPMFANLDITDNLVIKVIYSSNHESIPNNRLRTIVSNDGCNEAPSVYMYENRQHIVGGVRTLPDANMENDAHILQRPPLTGNLSSNKEVSYMFYGGELTLKNGDRYQTIPVKGNFNKIACPLKIGYGADLLPFKGEIDEFTIYICRTVLNAV